MRVLCEFGGTVAEMVDALAAVEVAANFLDNAKIYFKIKDERLEPVARAAWFVKDVLIPGEDKGGFDLTVDLTSDKEHTHAVELEHHRRLKEIIDNQLAELSEKMHVAVDKLKKPNGYGGLTADTRIWDRMAGYLVTLAEAGDPTNGLGESVHTISGIEKPFLPLPKGIKEKTNKTLHEMRHYVLPGVPYIVVGDHHTLDSKGYRKWLKPKGWALVYLGQQTDPAAGIGLISNHRCKGVISMSGGISRVGWAADVPMILEFTEDPENAYWTSVRSGRSATVDLTNEETTPETVENTLRAMYQMSHGIEVE